MNVMNKLQLIKSARGFALALLAVGGLTLTSCNNDDDDTTVVPPTPSQQNVVDFITSTSATSGSVTAANLSILSAAVTRSGLADSLRGSNVTIFAPSDDAFRAIGVADANAVNALPQDSVRKILRYHVLSQPFSSSSVSTSGTTGYTTYGNGTVYIGQNGSNQLTVNGARVLQAYQASNGFVYIIDRVLVPGTQNLSQFLAGNPNYSLLNAAVARAATYTDSAGTANPFTTLTTGGPYTVFAPNDAAFQAAGYADVAAINAADPRTLYNILSYHVANGRYFSPGFTNNGTITTLGGNTFTTSVNGNTVSFLGAGNGTNYSNITTGGSDIVATNGVIYGIDRVLLPR